MTIGRLVRIVEDSEDGIALNKLISRFRQGGVQRPLLKLNKLLRDGTFKLNDPHGSPKVVVNTEKED